MQLRAKKYLFDALLAARDIESFTSGKNIDAYISDPLLQAAVERKFTIIGEALVQMSKTDAHTAQSLTDFAQIVGFRNRIVHGYSDIDARAVWKVVADDLSNLIAEIEKLLT